MKKQILLFIVSFILIGEIFGQDYDIIRGRLTLAPNPCEGNPPLPGMVFAVENDTSVFILSINNMWKWSDAFLTIDDKTFEPDDLIEVTGTIFDKIDSCDKQYYEIDVESISHAITSINQINDTKTSIHFDSFNGNLFINSNDLIITKVDIFDILGRNIYHLDNAKSNNISIEKIKNRGVFIVKISLINNQTLTKKILF